MYSNKQFLIHNAELVLSGSVNDFSSVLNALVLYGLEELVFNSRVVRLDKVLVNKLDSNRRLA